MNWLDLTVDELQSALKEMGEPAFRAKQIFSWLHKGVSFDEMTNLPKTLREKAKAIPLGGARILEKLISRDGTVKYLFALEDGNVIEGVLMRYQHGNTLCISTQVGCRMGCSFCASTLGGLVRNLNPGEMLGQILAVEAERPQTSDQRAVTNVVLMGSGEPLDNYDNVVKFLKLVNDPQGICISHRNISLSTCGLVDKMRELARSGLNVTLSVSLHAPNDDMRSKLMPIANRYSIAEVVDAARDYVRETGRRVIFEYALVQGVNDSPEHAQELSRLLKRLQCHVNLIPLNPVAERGLTGSTHAAARAFLDALTDLGVSATIRREMGSDIQGACGQLRRSYLATAANQLQTLYGPDPAAGDGIV